MEPRVAAAFEALINEALARLVDVKPKSSSFDHSGSTKRSLDAALLSLAGRRHRLGVIELSEQTQIMFDQERLRGFHQNMPSSLTALDRIVTNDKQLTKRILREEGLPVARGAMVTTPEDALRSLHELGGPVVVKPLMGSNGNGITVGVQDEAAFMTAVNDGFSKGSRILVEECVPSIDLRIIVIGGRAAAAMMRVPANVLGDGRSTIGQLINQKNSYRAANAFHRFVPIKITEAVEAHLAKRGLALDSVIESGRRVFLHYKANLSSGGDSINVTGRLHPEFMRLAERAMKCFDSANHAGVDILAERLNLPPDAQRHVICEINCNNDLPIHVFPLYGKSIDVARMEIEAYFPVTSLLRRLWNGGPTRDLSQVARRPDRFNRDHERAQAKFADPAAWPGLTSALAHPGRHERDPSFDSPRDLDASWLTRSLSDLGWCDVRTVGRLIIADQDGRDVILERSGRSVFASAAAIRPEVLSKLLREAGIPACRVRRFSRKKQSAAKALFESAPGPWVMRPAGRRRRVATEHPLRDSRHFDETWSELALRSVPVILEQTTDAFAVRLLFLNSEVASCLVLLPVGLVGDGESTVEQLIAQKVAGRENHPYLRHLPIRESAFGDRNLADRQLSRSTVLAPEQWTWLDWSPRPEVGGETVRLATCPVPGLSEMALAVLRLLSNPPVAAVTFVTRPPAAGRSLRHWLVAEVDPDPVIAEFAWPWAGEAMGGHLYRALAQVVQEGQRYQLTREAARPVVAR